jgi:hypothetical protein
MKLSHIPALTKSTKDMNVKTHHYGKTNFVLHWYELLSSMPSKDGFGVPASSSGVRTSLLIGSDQYLRSITSAKSTRCILLDPFCQTYCIHVCHPVFRKMYGRCWPNYAVNGASASPRAPNRIWNVQSSSVLCIGQAVNDVRRSSM